MDEGSDIAGVMPAASWSEDDSPVASEDFPIFDISGRHYVAVPARYCEAEQTTRPDQSSIGRITLGGELHFLFGRANLPDEIVLSEVLTRRELQVAALVADGKCDKQIARMLGISCYTVREHLRRTFSKLHVANRSALVALVVRQQSSLRPPRRD